MDTPAAAPLSSLPALQSLDTTQLVALAAALGWASGVRLYAVLLITGLVGQAGWIELPPGLQLLQHPVVLGVSGLLFAVEFLADKIPGLDSVWDVVHTVIRIPAGAALAAAVFGVDDATWTVVAALLGGTLAAASHTTKLTTRAAVNTSPEPFSNIGLSLVEDAFVPLMMWLAVSHPLVFYPLLGVVLLVSLVLVWVLWRFLAAIWRRFVRRRTPGDMARADA